MDWKYSVRELPHINDVVLVCFDMPSEDKAFLYDIGVRKTVNKGGDWRWHSAKTGDVFIYDVEWWHHLENPNY